MSIKINLDTVVCKLVEVMLPRGSDEKKLLILEFYITVITVEGQEIQEKAVFLFHRPGNYTKVMWRYHLRVNDPIQKFPAWRVVSNHDSAWSSDGVSDSLRKLENELRASRRRKVQEIVAEFSVI